VPSCALDGVAASSVRLEAVDALADPQLRLLKEAA